MTSRNHTRIKEKGREGWKYDIVCLGYRAWGGQVCVGPVFEGEGKIIFYSPLKIDA